MPSRRHPRPIAPPSPPPHLPSTWARRGRRCAAGSSRRRGSRGTRPSAPSRTPRRSPPTARSGVPRSQARRTSRTNAPRPRRRLPGHGCALRDARAHARAFWVDARAWLPLHMPRGRPARTMPLVTPLPTAARTPFPVVRPARPRSQPPARWAGRGAEIWSACLARTAAASLALKRPSATSRSVSATRTRLASAS